MANKNINGAELDAFLESNDLLSIVQKRQEKYSYRWSKFIKNDESINPATYFKSWNWAAFFFQESWLLYRKMYKLFAIFAVLKILLVAYVFTNPVFADSVAYNILTFAPFIIIGLFGNGWYLNKALNVYASANQQFGESTQENSNAKLQYYLKNGGTNMIPVVLYIGITILFAIIVFMRFMEELITANPELLQ